MKIVCKNVALTTVLCFLFLLIAFGAGSQNLVVNPSFENTVSNCANTGGEGFRTDLAGSWNSANSNVPGDSCSSPDLYSACNVVFGMLTPTYMPGGGQLALGYQYSHTGTRHVGIITHEPLSEYREYIQGKTSSPLSAGQPYCVSMYVSLADYVAYATNNIGVYFSNTQYMRDACTAGSPIYVTPQLNYDCSAITDVSENWVRLQWDYVAAGGEQYFVIGNFFNNAGTIITATGQPAFPNPYAYYYIDDVSIIPGSCCAVNIEPVPTVCITDAAFNLTALPPLTSNCSPQPLNGTWSGTGITNTTAGTFDPSVAGIGTHTIIYTLPCGAVDTVTIAVSACVTLTACRETNGNITATSGNAPHTWYSQTTTQDCSACFVPCSFPPGCAVNVTTWTSFATGTTATPPSFPVKLQDNNGDSLLITAISSLPACPTTACPAIDIDTSNVQPESCPSASDGSFSAATTGGVSPWDYTLKTNGGTTVATFSNVPGVQNFTGLAAGTYSLISSDANSCADTITVIITALSGGSATANAGPDQTICSNSALLAGNTPTSGTGAWTVISGTGTVTTPTSPTSDIAGLGTGSITLVWTVTSGCATDSDTVVITNTGGGPTVSVATTPVICGSAGTATATASGGTGTLTYFWSTGAATPSISNLAAGTYTVTVTDGTGCNAFATGTVLSSGGVVANAGTDVTINAGDTVQLSASGGSSYTWTPSEGLDCTNCKSPIASPIQTTLYCVTVSDNGCSDSSCLVVTVTGTADTCNSMVFPSGSVYTPSAFTPNNDGLNDVYKPVGNCVHNYNFVIFDRWGEKLFETNDINEGWNGYYKGKLCKSDVYTFKVTFMDDPKNNFHQYIGRVTLLH